MTRTTLFCLGLVIAGAAPVPTQSAADSAGIRAAAHDYIDGWYEGDAARMERALHPHLAKRLVFQDSRGRSRLVDITALELVASTRAGSGKIPEVERRDSVTIFEIFGNAAVAKIEATAWVDYLQLLKWNGRWVIVNVVWENRPR